MERLTDKITNIETGKVLSHRLIKTSDYIKAIDKLGQYEDAEEQGLLLRLPVAIGRTLYQNRKGNIVELKTIGIIYDILNKEWLYEVAVQRGLDWVKTVCSIECVGEVVFLTKEEAEHAFADEESEKDEHDRK